MPAQRCSERPASVNVSASRVTGPHRLVRLLRARCGMTASGGGRVRSNWGAARSRLSGRVTVLMLACLI